MVGALSASVAIRRAIDRDAESLLIEQRSADAIVALTYEQRLAAYRFLLSPDPAHRAAFQRIGDEADGRMREYLFHRLSPEARLQVEVMKETHASFEVAVEQVFELADRGDVAGARARLAALSPRTAALDSAVSRFLNARGAQRAGLLREYETVSHRMRTVLIATGLVLLTLSLWLVGRLRRVVIAPLDALTQAAERIRAGEGHARVPSQRFAELETVGAAFNAMADTVQDTRETIEMQNEELRQSLDQLQNTQDELVQHEKLSAMGQMLAGLAHELNNPLAGVLGLAQVLRAELAESPDAAVRALDSDLAEPIEREATRARDLVRTLLSFARKPSGAIEAVSLAAAAATATGLRSHAFVLARKTLHVDIPSTLIVLADVQKLQHAIVNVINNALDALVASDGTRLEVSARGDANGLVSVHFDDDGGGFANPRAAFDPFYTTKPAGEGTGLGLALVEQYVNACGGTVSAQNRPGGGARVTFALRRASGDAVPARSAPRDADGPRNEVAASPPRSERRRILVVDDEPALREVQRRLLILEGLDVVLAENGDHARTLLGRERVDLVISDLRMPGAMDGRSLMALLSEEHPRLAASMLIITGDVGGAASAPPPVPVERLLYKPFTRDEYLSKVRTALDTATPRD